MASITELAAKGIDKVHLPAWNNRTYLQLDLHEGGFYGPWGTLHDPISEAVMNGEPIKILVLGLSDEYLPYEGES